MYEFTPRPPPPWPPRLEVDVTILRPLSRQAIVFFGLLLATLSVKTGGARELDA